jgi:hypothetical protein
MCLPTSRMHGDTEIYLPTSHMPLLSLKSMETPRCVYRLHVCMETPRYIYRLHICLYCRLNRWRHRDMSTDFTCASTVAKTDGDTEICLPTSHMPLRQRRQLRTRFTFTHSSHIAKRYRVLPPFFNVALTDPHGFTASYTAHS